MDHHTHHGHVHEKTKADPVESGAQHITGKSKTHQSMHHDVMHHDHERTTSRKDGMDHDELHDHSGHAGMIDDFKKRFYVVLALTIPIMLLSPMIQHWLGVNSQFTG